MSKILIKGGKRLEGEITVQGAKNIFLGGMGLFHTKVTGPGKVYLQTMPIIKTAKAIEPYITFPTNTDGGNGINIRLGE